MSEALWLVVGAGVLLAGQWWGTRLSRSKLDSSKCYLEAGQAVQKMAVRTALMAVRESKLDQQMATVLRVAQETREKAEATERTLTAVWEYLKLEGTTPGRRRHPPPMSRTASVEEAAIPRAPMPRISRDAPAWGYPESSSPETSQERKADVPTGLGPPT